jgi:hypothetical protein
MAADPAREIRVRSESFGVDFYICLDKDTYLRRLEKGGIAFTINEMRTLHEEKDGTTADDLVAALTLKYNEPGVKITSFRGRKCLRPTKL